MTRLTLHRLTTDLDPRFTAFLRLYAAAFPAAERKPAAQLRTMLGEPRYRLLVAEQQSVQPQSAQPQPPILGLAILAYTESAEIALLEYLAVQEASRGNGVGRWLLQQVLHSVDITRRPLLIETESDRSEPPGLAPSSDASIRSRRKQFYRSAGARELIGLRYLMPAVSTLLPPPMELMLFARPMPASLPKRDLHNWLAALYTEVYRQQPGDSRLSRMLDNLPEQISVA